MDRHTRPGAPGASNADDTNPAADKAPANTLSSNDVTQHRLGRRFGGASTAIRFAALGLLIVGAVAGTALTQTGGTHGASAPTAGQTRYDDRANRDEDRLAPTPFPTPTSPVTPKASPTKAPSKPAPAKTVAPTRRATAAPTTKVSIPSSCSAYKGNQAIACALLPSFGFSISQMTSLIPMWNRESGWSTSAANPSGAYGIPQALPGSKMGTVGSDWRTNAATQIKWGLGYIKGRYGSPAAAWSYWQAHGWY